MTLPGLSRLVTIPGLTGSWDPQPWDVERVAVNDVIQWWIPEYALVTAVTVLPDGRKRLTIDNKQGTVRDVTLPGTVAGQQAAGLVMVKLIKALRPYSWWQEITSGAVFYVRTDGLMFCDTAGPGWTAGQVVSRADLGELSPFTV